MWGGMGGTMRRKVKAVGGEEGAGGDLECKMRKEKLVF